LAVDGPVLALGFVAIVLLVLVLAAVGAAAVDRRAALTAGGRPSETPGRAMQVVRRTRLGPPATTGVGMALDPRGGTASSVRSAILGLVFGTVGVLAVIVLIGSVDGLARTPARYGSPFDALVSGFSGDALAEGGDRLLADPDVARAGLGYGGLARVGGVEVNTFAIESLKGDLYFTLLEGRRPTGGAEVVVGRTILEQAGASIGDEVEIDGMGGSLRATVVGTAVFPIVDERSAPGRGVLLGQRDFERVSSPEEINADVLIDWADGVDVGVANAALEEATGTEVFAPRLPSDVNNLREVEPLLRSLAAFLGILAALALVHALMSTVRMRRGDLAVLRTLGFVRRQLGSTLVWQALTIGLVGLVAGVPLGLAAGQLVWRSLAGSLGVVDHVVAPTLGIAGVVFTTLVVLYVAAVVPGRAARSVAAASVLRSG
ncbi:MAG: FtsX-like permease family protein, partial [Acidimicrobiales bacterium]